MTFGASAHRRIGASPQRRIGVSAVAGGLLGVVLWGVTVEAQQRRVSMARLGYPNGLSLDGTTASGQLVFPLPDGVPVTRGTVTLALEVSPNAAPGSNLQIFVNGARRHTLLLGPDTTRRDTTEVTGTRRPPPAPDSGVRTVTIPLDSSDLRGNAVAVEVRSFLAVGRDRCLDERLGSAFATIRPESRLDHNYDPARVLTAAAAWSLLPDTVWVALPPGELSVAQLTLAYQLLLELRADNREVVLVRDASMGHLAIDSTTTVPDLVSWRQVVTRRGSRVGNNPTLQELGITDLARSYAYRASWRVPIDLRSLPADRVPTAVDLDLAGAPATVARGVQFHVFLNGTLLRAVPAREDGRSERVSVDLPAHLLTTYNELRVDVQRQRDPADLCQEAEALYPAQILGSSVIRTEEATRSPNLFTGTAVRLPDRFPLYLPPEALGEPERFLTAIVSLARGIWGNRTPAIRVYSPRDTLDPDSGFVAIGLPRGLTVERGVRDSAGRLVLRGPGIDEVNLGNGTAGTTAVVQVARLGSTAGVVALLPDTAVTLPDRPEQYGNADVVVLFADATSLRINTANLPYDPLVGLGPSWREYAWTTELIVGVILAILGVTAAVAVFVSLGRRRRRKKPA